MLARASSWDKAAEAASIRRPLFGLWAKAPILASEVPIFSFSKTWLVQKGKCDGSGSVETPQSKEICRVTVIGKI
jgi:hypothetical protein